MHGGWGSALKTETGPQPNQKTPPRRGKCYTYRRGCYADKMKQEGNRWRRRRESPCPAVAYGLTGITARSPRPLDPRHSRGDIDAWCYDQIDGHDSGDSAPAALARCLGPRPCLRGVRPSLCGRHCGRKQLPSSKTLGAKERHSSARPWAVLLAAYRLSIE